MAEEEKAPDAATVFCKAATDDDLAALQRLAEDGGRHLIRDSVAVIEAADNGRMDCLRWLLNQGADANCVNGGKTTPLIWAAFSGHKDAVELLLSRGANRAYKDGKNKSALDYAKDKGRAEIQSLLLRDSDEVSWYNTVDNRAMQEVFNFRLKERITLIRKTEGGDVEAVTRQAFSSRDDSSSLRRAFDEYRRRGGKIGEEEVFEGRLGKPGHLPKPGSGT